MSKKLVFLLSVQFFLTIFPAEAYIGPGAGVGVIAVVLGILASIVMAFFAILWYPVKRLLKKRTVTTQKPGKGRPGNESPEK